MTSLSTNMESDPEPNIERIAMSEEDALFYRIKYGVEPTFRIEKKFINEDPLEIRYILTNIPRPGDIDYD